MFPPRPTELAHTLISAAFSKPPTLAIDATAGNGHDTLFLANSVGPNGHVLAFDIQAEAVNATRERLTAAHLADRVELLQQCHSTLNSFAPPASADVIMFNLGYLPGITHDLITQTHLTLTAIDHACKILKPSGILSIICYPGHSGGDSEAHQVQTHLEQLPSLGWRLAKYSMLATKKPAPFLLLATPKS